MLISILNRIAGYLSVSLVIFIFFVFIPSHYCKAKILVRACPAHLSATDQCDNMLFQNGFLDVTLYDGWNGKSVDKTGNLDSTAAIQKAAEDAYWHQLVLYFPNQDNGMAGVYKISETINCRQYMDSTDWSWWYSPGEGTIAYVWMGAKNGNVRPKIKLAPGASGFGTVSAPKPMIRFWASPGHFEDEANSPDYLDNSSDISFGQFFRGIDIDTSVNAGAVGIYFHVAQGASVEDTTIDATGSVAGIWGTPVLNASGFNVEFIGGRSAIYINGNDFTNPYNGLVEFFGCEFIDQTETVIRVVSGQASPMQLTGFQISSSSAIPIFAGSIGRGGMVLTDGLVDVAPGSPLVSLSDMGAYIRDVYVKGASSIATGFNLSYVNNNWTWIKEFSRADSWGYRNLINGVSGTSDVVSLEMDKNYDSAALVSSLVDKHKWGWPTFPHPMGTDIYNAKIQGGAKGDGVTDDAAALQAAINYCDTNNKTLFLPKGKYMISMPLTLKADSRVIGVSKMNTLIAPLCSWKPAGAGNAVMITTEDSATGKAILSDILIANCQTDYLGNNVLDNWPGGGYCDQFSFTALEWKAGRSSIVRHITSDGHEPWSGYPSKLTYPNFKVSGNGGGRWFSILRETSSGTDGVSAGPSFTVDDSDDYFSLYGYNSGRDPDNVGITVTNSSNKHFQGINGEGGITQIRFSNSNNCTVINPWKNNLNMVGVNRGVIESLNSNNILAAMCGTRLEGAYGEKHIYETFGSGTYYLTEINAQLFKRGEPSYTAIGVAMNPASPSGLGVR